MASLDDKPSIKEYFTGKNVFITGGTGFMGKVLIEKLLRSCPGIKNIYVLMRTKKEKSPEERLRIITELPLFDKLKSQQPDAVKKIIPVVGDVNELGLGLSEEDRHLLIKNTNVVYHAAASIRFDDHLTDAIILNTRGTREVVYLCSQMENLDVFTHISTTYSQIDKKVIEERIYPALADWREAIKLAETVDKHTMDIFSTKYIAPHPNTYTFTKSLSEHVVNDLCKEFKIPFVIFRPSIVISSLSDPIKGWIDNMNGPGAIFLAVGKGILRSLYTDKKIVSDFLPVDLIIKAIIIASWDKAIEKNPEKKLQCVVYNGSNHNIRNINHEEMVRLGDDLMWEAPINNVLWYPKCTVTNCWYNHFLITVFYQLIPALFIDGLLKISGRKPILIMLHRKIYIANMALQFFITNEWEFVNDNAIALEDKLKEVDCQDFSYNKDQVDVKEYFRNCLKGGKKYVLKEDDSTIEDAKTHLRRMWIISIIFNTLWYLGIFYILVFKIDIISILYRWLDDCYLYFITD